jgi:hypothetical protein
MMLEYPTEYTDRKGTEFSKFITDGQSLKIKLRGVEFEGHFWELAPIKGQEEIARKYFDLNEFGELNGITDLSLGESSSVFSLNVNIPIKVVTNDNNEIDAIIEFGTNPHKMIFIINEEKYESERPSFEYGLASEFTKSLNIKHIKCCINCKYSEYSPYGSDEYGSLMCFKKSKKAWSKIGYQGLKKMEPWPKILNIEKTQEAFWCNEFKIKKASI